MSEVAICAACEQPIEKGERFVLAGSEVFHKTKECVSRIAASRYVRMRKEATRLARQNHLLEAENRRNADAMKGAHRRIEAIRADLDGSVEAMKRQLRTAERERAEALSREMAARQECEMLRQVHGNTVAEIRRLQGLLQEATAKPATAPAPAAPDVRDTRDDAQVRFSLLELDKP
jgi:hypothetical protein